MVYINRIKAQLYQKFDITNMGEIKTLLDMEIVRLRDGLVFLYQNQYLLDMFLRYKMEGCILITTPIAEPIVSNGTNINITEY
jgi:hypothetical protein